MENVSLKIEPQFLKEIESTMKKNRYMTKTEFIREAIRDKLKELEKQNMLKHLDRIAGVSKHKTTDNELHKAGEKAFKELEKKFSTKSNI